MMLKWPAEEQADNNRHGANVATDSNSEEAPHKAFINTTPALAQGVSRSKSEKKAFTCCLSDESRPLIHAVQAECINCFMLLQSKVAVVSDEEKVV